jgi:hypothetical protein
MPEPNPDTVFVAESLPVAEAVVKFLAANEVPAEVYTSATQSFTEPITGVSEVTGGDQFEVRISDPAQLKAARDLIASAESAAIVQSIREKRLQRTGTVTAKCEECGKSSEWPAASMGTTETCPFCSAYMDIPDPDDDWSDVDFGKPEDEGEIPE